MSKIKKYANSEYCILTHERFKCFYTIVSQADDYKEAHSVSIPNLIDSTVRSKKLTEKSARILGEIFLNIADQLKHKA